MDKSGKRERRGCTDVRMQKADADANGCEKARKAVTTADQTQGT